MIAQTIATTILLFILDDVGAADLTGPTFDNLRANGVEFTRAYSQPWCAPTRDSLYRSRWKAKGAGSICDHVNDTRYPNLQKLFQGHGVPTTLIGKAHRGGTDLPIDWMSAPHTMGWDHWHVGVPVTLGNVCFPGWPGSDYVINDGVQEYDPRHHTIREEEAALIATDGLIVVSFKDAHSPWEPAPYSTPNGTTDRDLFEAEIASLDTAVANVLAQHPGAWVIVLGDNGTPSAVDTDNLRDSKHSVYEGGVRVPLIFYGPTLTPRVVDDPVSVVDIAPTIIEAMGWDIPAWVEGESLIPALNGQGVARPWVYVESKQFGTSAVIEKRWKLVVNGTHEVFDLQADPGETLPMPPFGAEYVRLLGLWSAVQ